MIVIPDRGLPHVRRTGGTEWRELLFARAGTNVRVNTGH